MEKTLDEIEAENKKMWADYVEGEKAIQKEINRINIRILKAIGNQLGKQFLDDVVECFNESQACYNLQLVRKPTGEWQEESYDSFTGVWVDQWSVGYSGDSWEGHICIELKKGLWLKTFYSM